MPDFFKNYFKKFAQYLIIHDMQKFGHRHGHGLVHEKTNSSSCLGILYMYCTWLFLFTIISLMHPLSAGIEKYFKKIEAKPSPSHHQMRQIDFIYMINLDERPEKFKKCVQQLEPYGIHPYRFSAVNGWKLPLSAINDLGVKYAPTMARGLQGITYDMVTGHSVQKAINVPGRTYFCQAMSRGAIGIALSHLSVLQDADNCRYKTIWIMEDDIEVIQDPRMVSDLIEKLDAFVGPDKWDVLFTDMDSKDKQGQYLPCSGYARRPNFLPKYPKRFRKKITIDYNFRKIGARYGSYSMIIRRSGICKILHFLKCHQLFLPYDMEYCLPPDIRLYTVLNDVVSTEPTAASDNWWPGYK